MSSRSGGTGRGDRAAQFLPFAALSGYDELVRAQERVREERRVASPEEAERISGELAAVRRGARVRVEHYAHEAYVWSEGVVGEFDPCFRWMRVGPERIRFEDVWEVEVVGEEGESIAYTL